MNSPVSGRRPVPREKAEETEREIETGAKIQRVLLIGQADVNVSGLDSHAEAIPSSRIDGDFFDFFSASPESLDFFIGDVMGKGITAALTAAGVKTAIFRCLLGLLAAQGKAPGLSALMDDVDRYLSGRLAEVGTFLTFNYCRIEPSKGLLRFVDAGHTALCHYRASDGTCWLAKGSNMPLGFVASQRWREYAIPVEKGDVLFFYSDGMSEAESRDGERFGEDRVRWFVQSHAAMSARELVNLALRTVFFFSARAFSDDVTALAVRITGESPSPQCRFAENIRRDDREYVSHLREAFIDQMGQYRFPATRERVLGLAIGLIEAVANVIEHTAGDAEVRWSIGRETLSVDFFFSSSSYVEFSPRAPDIHGYPERGFGSLIMAGEFDSVTLLRGRGADRRLSLLAFAVAHGEAS